MIIKSDEKIMDPLKRDWFLLNLWKYSQNKLLTVMSLGFYWDFRNEKPDKTMAYIVDETIELFLDNINEVHISSGEYYLEYMDNAFWIANKYYAWRLEKYNGDHVSIGLSIKQISRLNNILVFVEERDLK